MDSVELLASDEIGAHYVAYRKSAREWNVRTSRYRLVGVVANVDKAEALALADSK